MKRISLIATLCLCYFFSIGQTTQGKTTVVRYETLTGPEAIRKMEASKPKDPRIYDVNGKVIDSAEVQRLLATYEYWLGRHRINNEYKHVLSKINFEQQAEIDRETKLKLKPYSPKLQEGTTLDLKPFKKYTDIKALDDKAIVLIIWCDGCYGGNIDAYKPVNDVLRRFINQEKLAIMTVTSHSVEQANVALKKSPIINTQHIIAATDIIKEFEIKRPVILITDTDHKILYSVTNNAEMTARTLFFTLREIVGLQ